MYEFSNEMIEEIWYIMMGLEETSSTFPIASYGRQGPYMISNEMYLSVMETLITIDYACSRGAYSDAYTLTRKYRDDLMQHLFIINTIINMENKYYDNNKIENSVLELLNNQEQLIEIISRDINNCILGEWKGEQELSAESWIYDNLENPTCFKYRKKYFSTSKYKEYLISNDESIKYIMKKYFEEIWRESDRKLNNYVHCNGRKYLCNNYCFINDMMQTNLLELIEILKNITIIFLCILALIDSRSLSAMDYTELLECGDIPDEKLIYKVNSCVLDFMYNNTNKELLEYIQKNQKGDMNFIEIE